MKKDKSKNTSVEHSQSEISRIINENTDFDTIETYKSIRTNVMLSTPKQQDGTVIAVSSSLPGEGKTTTAINLAITFAQTGARCILVDCDLRKSRVHRYLQIERRQGVSNVVCGFTTLKEAIKKNVVGNLDCLTAGDIPPNPAELIETDEFGKMIDQLKKQYDYIFIDTPPVNIVTDAVLLSRYCAGVIVVARTEYSNYDALDVMMNDLERAKIKILGVIMLTTRESRKKYAHSYYSSYSYKYKYKYGYKYGYRYGYHYGYKEQYGDNPRESSKK